jgi:hypothetical protein
MYYSCKNIQTPRPKQCDYKTITQLKNNGTKGKERPFSQEGTLFSF